MAESLTIAEAARAPYEAMSPMLLSAEPLEAPQASKRRKPENDWWDVLFSHLEQRLGYLRAWRWSWWAHWSRLAEYFNPRRYHWVVVANRMTRGNPINDQIIDSTPFQAMRTCSSGMWSGLTNPARPWIKLGISQPGVELDAPAKLWLEDTQERIYTVLDQSNFYTIMAQAFEDVTVFGTAPIIIYEDYEDVIRCYLPCAGEYYLGAGSRFDNNTIYREFVLTVLQIVEMFGVENCPEAVTKPWQQGGASLDNEFVIAHAIEPNFPIANKANGAKKLKILPDIFVYREIYWLKGVKGAKPMSRRGFMEKPFFVLQWARVSNDPYGRSPCMDCLGDNKQIQRETLRKDEFIEKGVRPPMGADPQLKNEPASITPAAINYVSTEGGKKGFFPLFEPQAQWLAGITADIALVSKRIETCLFVDVFMAITQMQGVQPRNELELTKRDLERLQKLGPVIELVENALEEAIQRILRILQRRRLLAPIPRSLQQLIVRDGRLALKIGFVSIMRMAQRSSESVAMKDFFATMGELSSAAKAAGLPDPLRKVNLDKAADLYADRNNVPPEILFTEREVLKADQQRAKAMQQAQQQRAGTQAPQNMQAAVDAAKTLSETNIGGGNTALSALLGQPGGGAPAQWNSVL